MLEAIYMVLIHLFAVVGLYWSIFWFRNLDFLVEFHRERNARKKL